MPTSFLHCLGVKPCFETKFGHKFPIGYIFLLCEKFWLKAQLLYNNY